MSRKSYLSLFLKTLFRSGAFIGGKANNQEDAVVQNCKFAEISKDFGYDFDVDEYTAANDAYVKNVGGWKGIKMILHIFYFHFLLEIRLCILPEMYIGKLMQIEHANVLVMCEGRILLQILHIEIDDCRPAPHLRTASPYDPYVHGHRVQARRNPRPALVRHRLEVQTHLCRRW